MRAFCVNFAHFALQKRCNITQTVKMKDIIIDKETSERAVLVGLITPRQNEAKANEYLDELAFLADTAGAVTEKSFCRNSTVPIRALLSAKANWKRFGNMSRTTI